MRHPSNHFFEFDREELRGWCAARGWPAFRAAQVLEWVYKKNIIDPVAMTNLSKLERETLQREMTFLSGEVVTHSRATDGTQKLLVEWWDGEEKALRHQAIEPSSEEKASSHRAIEASSERKGTREGGIEGSRGGGDAEGMGGITRLAVLPTSSNGAGGHADRQTECVMIPALGSAEHDTDRRTACVSSQVGCPVGCRFCASGLGGLDANLSAGRIVEQVWRLQQLPGVGRISNVVFMGMGEPLSNFAAVTKSVRTLTSPWGLNISARKITISTVGLPKYIERLATELDLPVTLALSLHAPNDELRRQLIPWAEYTTIEELLGSCSKWFEKTGREITLEYTLLGGVNDSAACAEQLAKVARTLRANINLIRYNEVKGVPYKRPRDEDVIAFQGILRGHRLNAHIRASRGRDIAAACGQLRHEARAVGAGS